MTDGLLTEAQRNQASDSARKVAKAYDAFAEAIEANDAVQVLLKTTELILTQNKHDYIMREVVRNAEKPDEAEESE